MPGSGMSGVTWLLFALGSLDHLAACAKKTRRLFYGIKGETQKKMN